MDRYENQHILKNEEGKRYLSFTKYPKIPLKHNDIYIYPTLDDRLDKLALSYYKDSKLWWIIAVANNIPRDSFNIPPGMQIRIPQDIQNILFQFRRLNNYD